MIKTTIGELKLYPLKENGRFVFINDCITINGKVSKGDSIKIFVDSYDAVGGKYSIKQGAPATAILTVRGKQHEHTDTKNSTTIEDFYNQISEVYKTHFYFGNK